VLTANFGNYAIVLVASLFAFACCLCTAVFVIYPEENNKQNEKKKSLLE
jgi:hypothetical protein